VLQKGLNMSIFQLLKSRTVQFALALAVLSVLQGYVFLLHIKPEEQMLVGVALSLIITLLRIVTTQPIAEK
jgi:hypothetical protein